MSLFKPTLIALSVASMFSVSPAPAADHVALDEISVVATRTTTALEKTPASVSVANQLTLEKSQAATLLPVLRAMPNVELGGGPRVDALVPIIRGAFGAGVTLLLDGARQNDIQAPGMKAPLYVDPYFLKQVEVLRGAASSLYGSGGNGGVMALTTLSARDLLETGQSVGGGVKVGYASGDRSSHLNARLYGGNEQVDVLLMLGKHDWDKIRQPGGTDITPNDGNSATGLLKFGVSPRRDLRLELSHQFYRSDNLATNNPQVGQYKKTTDTASIPFIQPTHVDQRNTVANVQFGDSANAAAPYVDARVYRSFLQVRLDPYATNPAYQNAATSNFQLTETRTDGASLQWTQSFGRHRLSLGGDVFSDHLNSAAGSTTIAVNPVNPAGERKGSGIFGQDQISLGGGWQLIPTLRYDHYRATQTNGSQAANEKSRVSPKLTLSWENAAGLLVYGSYGEGFRAPAVNELFQKSTLGTFSWFLPNSALRPEVDKTVELGAKYRQKNLWASGDDLRLRGALFDSRVQDLITSLNLGNIPGQSSCSRTGLGCQYQYQNMAHASRTGVELEAVYKRDLWQYQLAYGRVRVKSDDSGENLFSPPDKVTAQVHRRLPALDATLLWNSTLVAAQKYDATVLRRRPGYAVHDLFLSWQPGNQKYRVDAGISNLFDKGYAVYQSSNLYANTYQEGRSLKVALNADF